ncbi:MAG: peptidylprolyl isomerase, partial [bacterium]
LGIFVGWGTGTDDKMAGKNSKVGKINDHTIYYPTFQAMLTRAKEQQRVEQKTGRSQVSPYEDTDFFRKQFREQQWENLVQETLMANIFENYHIRATSSEVYNFLLKNPIINDSSLYTNGEFDTAKYKTVLDNPQLYDNPQVRMMESQLFNFTIPFKQFQLLLNASIKITDSEIRREYIDNNQRIKTEYLSVDAFSLDYNDTISMQEVKQEYNKNHDSFFVEKSVILQYITFEKKPGPADFAEAKEQIETIYEYLAQGENFSELAKEYSEDKATSIKEGELGFFSQDDYTLPKPLRDTVFSLKQGQFSRPFKTDLGFHIAKLIRVKKQDDRKMADGAHILIKITMSPSTEDSLKELADSIKTLYLDSLKKDLKLISESNKFAFNQTKLISNFDSIPNFSGVDYLAGLKHFCLSEKEESVILENRKAIYIFKKFAENKKTYIPVEEIMDRIKTDILAEKKAEMAKAILVRCIEELKTNKSTMAQIAERDTMIKYFSTENDPLARVNYFSGFGTSPEIAQIFTLKKDEISDILENKSDYFHNFAVFKILDISPIDEKDYENTKKSVKERILYERTNGVFPIWYENLKNQSRIESNLSAFYYE